MLQNSRIPCTDSSRPYPESFTPPKGRAGYDVVIPFTKTCPASRSTANRSCSAGSLVHAFDPSPNGVAFASSTASSYEPTRNSPATGPNTSSDHIRIDGVRSATIVGGENHPGPDRRRPPHRTAAPLG